MRGKSHNRAAKFLTALSTQGSVALLETMEGMVDTKGDVRAEGLTEDLLGRPAFLGKEGLL